MSHTGGQGGGVVNIHASGKRRRARSSSFDGKSGGKDVELDSDTKDGEIKKLKRRQGPYSCPFRKRNPQRFNIRDHWQCAAKSYIDTSDLKYSTELYSGYWEVANVIDTGDTYMPIMSCLPCVRDADYRLDPSHISRNTFKFVNAQLPPSMTSATRRMAS